MTDVVTEIREAFESFKSHNDERLSALEKGLPIASETQAAADRANDAIMALQTKLDETYAEQQARADELEAMLSRERIAGSRQAMPSDKQMQNYAYWQTLVTNATESVDPGDVDLDRVNAYNKEFRAYLRRGTVGEVMNELSVGIDPDGGFWVSPDTSGRMAELVYESSPMRQVAAVDVVSGDALEGDLDLDEAGAGWVGEIAARSETTTPQVSGWRIPLHEMHSSPRATQRVLDMANRDVEGWLAGKVAGRFGRLEATAFVNGNGETQPRGITSYAAGTPDATPAGWPVIEQVITGHATLLQTDGLVDLVYSLKTPYRAGSIFAMNRTTEREVRQLTDGQSNYIWQPDFQSTNAARLLGFPVIEFSDLADIGAGTEPIAFGNFMEAYQIVDSTRGARTLRDPYTAKPRVVFYTTSYVGGDVVNFEAIKLQTVSA